MFSTCMNCGADGTPCAPDCPTKPPESHPAAIALREIERRQAAERVAVVDRDHLHRQPAVITARYALSRAQHLLPIERRAVLDELTALDSLRARLNASAAHLQLCRSALDSLRARQPVTEEETAALITLLELAAVKET